MHMKCLQMPHSLTARRFFLSEMEIWGPVLGSENKFESEWAMFFLENLNVLIEYESFCFHICQVFQKEIFDWKNFTCAHLEGSMIAKSSINRNNLIFSV